jgi:hypothetical protein
VDLFGSFAWAGNRQGVVITADAVGHGAGIGGVEHFDAIHNKFVFVVARKQG